MALLIPFYSIRISCYWKVL